MKISLQQSLFALATLAMLIGSFINCAFAAEQAVAVEFPGSATASESNLFGQDTRTSEESRTDRLEDNGALQNGACWKYRLEAGRFKRTYVCD
jgi:hypothetical protein